MSDKSCAGCAAVVCAVLILVGLLLAQGAVGSNYLDECPGQPFIPIYLVGMGVAIIVMFTYICDCGIFEWFAILYLPFFTCWIIAGNVCIFSIYKSVSFDRYPRDSYCDRTLYLFAFCTTILTDILLFAPCLIHCCSSNEEEPHVVTASQV